MHRKAQISSQKSISSKDIKNFWCPNCKSKEIIKWGYRHNKENKKQKYKCKNCNKHFVIDDGFYHLHKKKELITICLDLYMSGMSLRKIRNHIRQFTEQGISHMQVWRWIIKYSIKIKMFTDTLEPTLSRIYHADEIFIKCKGEQHYYWDMIDKGTRYLVATHYSTKRDSKSAKMLFIKAKHKPLSLFTDQLAGYKKAYRKVWGAKTRREDKQIYTRLKADRDKRNIKRKT